MADGYRSKRPGERRQFLGGALLGLAGGSLGACSTASVRAGSEQRRRPRRTGLTPAGLPPADAGYTQGILGEGAQLVLVSGQGPDDLKADVETQVRQTLENIRKVLAVAGASFENVVMIRGYFVHLLRDLPVYRKVRREYLVKPYPASTCVGVTELAVPGLQIEIEALAVV